MSKRDGAIRKNDKQMTDGYYLFKDIKAREKKKDMITGGKWRE